MVTSFGTRLFADDPVKIRSLGWAPSNRTGVLIKRGNLDTETDTQGEHHMKMKAGIGAMQL